MNSDQLLTRGVEQVLPDVKSLAELMAKRPIKLYLGIDPTGSELTLGHAVVLRKLQQFATAGHQVILLIGNGTVKIGDPTGRDSTRPELTDEQIEANFKNWQKQASRVLDFSQIEIRRNGDWLGPMQLRDFIKLMAKTTVQQLLERDMFQERIKNNLPIHTHELMYPLLQGFDSVEMDVDLEIGGSDQLFNMMMGRNLQKIYHQKEKWVLTTPIINGLDGRKMSKSYGNYVGLTEPAEQMYGKLMRIADEEIVTYFEALTDLPTEEIQTIKDKMAAGENPMTFKKQLAKTITAWLHDEAEANRAETFFEKTVQQSDLPEDMPVIKVKSGQTLIEILKMLPNELSGSQLRRLVEQGGIELHPSGAKATDLNMTIDLGQVEAIKVGKREFYRLEQA